MVVLTIDRSCRELSCRSLLLEKIIDVCETSVLGFWEIEPNPDSPDTTEPKVEESSACPPVPRISTVVDHTRIELSDNSLTNNIHSTTQDNGLSAYSARGHLSDDNIGCWTKGELEGNLDEDKHDCDTDSDTSSATEVAQNTSNQHTEANRRRTPEEVHASTELSHENNGNTGADDVDRLDAHAKVERLGGRHAS